MAELAGDFGKLRLPLPKSFNGEPSDWEDWSWNFKSYLAIFQPDSVDFLARSETSNTEILDAHFTGALPPDEAANMRMFIGNFTICLPICVQDLLDFWFARMKQEMVLRLGVG